MAPPVQSLTSEATRDRTHPAEPRLSWVGWLLVALVFVAGLFPFMYGGLVAGVILGVEHGAAAADATPKQSVGMAPDLTPEINALFAFGATALASVSVGLLVGAAVMWVASRYLVIPVLRSVRALTS